MGYINLELTGPQLRIYNRIRMGIELDEEDHSVLKGDLRSQFGDAMDMVAMKSYLSLKYCYDFDEEFINNLMRYAGV